MRYRLKKSIVLFSMCGEFFIFPSRASGFYSPVILSASPELTAVLRQEASAEEKLSEEQWKKLKRLMAAGLIEEFE